MESYTDSIRRQSLESWDSGPHQMDYVTLVIYIGPEMGIGQEYKGMNDRRQKKGGLEETRK